MLVRNDCRSADLSLSVFPRLPGSPTPRQWGKQPLPNRCERRDICLCSGRYGIAWLAGLLWSLLGIASLVGGVAAGASDPLLSAEVIQTQLTEDSVRMQRRIDALDDETHRLLEEYRSFVAQRDQLKAYNAELRARTQAQEKRIERLQVQLDSIDAIRTEIAPFMAEMVEQLGQLVALDLPFQQEQRRTAVTALAERLYAPDVSSAQVFRETLTVYQRELDYGRRLATYTGEIDFDGESRTVEFLRVGRLALFYRSLDRTMQGRWNPVLGAFEELPKRYAKGIDLGIRIAKEQAAPELLVLPMPAPKEREQ